MKKKSFEELYEELKKKAKPVAKWQPFVSGKDIPHKNKKKYSRKEKHKAEPQRVQPFYLLFGFC